MKQFTLISFAVLIAGLSSGCTNLVANQVFGDKGITVDTASDQKLLAGKIYKIGDKGMYYGPVCTKDYANKALQAIKTDPGEAKTDVLTDQLASDNITVGFPGFPTLQAPYKKTRVSGYRISEASVPDNGDSFFNYVRNGVADTCRGWLDSGQYVVVEKEGRATKSSKLIRGPLSGDLHIGSATIGGVGNEVERTGPSNVTFGIVGSNGKN